MTTSGPSQQISALQRQIERYQVVQAVSQELMSELDSTFLLQDILRSAIRVMEAQAGSLLLLDAETDELVFEVVEGGGGDRLRGTRMPRHQGIGGWVLDHEEAAIVDDTLRDRRFYPEIGASVDFATYSMLCVPMIHRGEAIGVIQVLNKQSGERFDESDKDLLIVLAAQSAIAIRNAQLYQELREDRDRLVAFEEDVRKRLARDLHDGPTQIVAAINMNLQLARRLTKTDPERVDTELVNMIELSNLAMRQLRTMLFDLRPVILETRGLIPALQVYSSRLDETERFAVYLEVNGTVPRLTRQAESAIFAVVQEAIGNAKKHSTADAMWIRVSCQDDALHVSVRDNGTGFDVESIQRDYDRRGSLGIINMRERAEMIRGQLTIESVIGQGTAVDLTCPLSFNVAT